MATRGRSQARQRQTPRPTQKINLERLMATRGRSQARQRQTPRPTQKTECQKNPDSIACLEEKLSAIRSSPVAVRRSSSVPYDPQIAFPLSSGGGEY